MIDKSKLKNIKFFENEPLVHHLNYALSECEEKNILRGWRPSCMEDKWLSYSEDGCVFVHRSWTGHLMYKFTIRDQSIQSVEIAMDDFVNMTNERKIEVFLSLLPRLSEEHENDWE
ncbi:hypothetical protein LW139_01660 [Proteus vulgaris]|uniref:hypothetical protein n=1 Tax=Proteus TaxID=583 RepID=UPI001D09EC3A|nr:MULTISPECIES: hypothetical protein [Proteus]UDN36395.1 hypothetical protein LG402_01685 [Proteus sp. NMG38-2]UPK81436.1 hypothetical protein LW139_01660 [Proteus vulgaris]